MGYTVKLLACVASITANFYLIISITIASQQDWYFVGYFNKFGEGLLEFVIFVPMCILAVIYLGWDLLKRRDCGDAEKEWNEWEARVRSGEKNFLPRKTDT